MTHSITFSLADFFAEQTRRFQSDLDAAFTEIYSDHYGLSQAEWRVLASLSEKDGITALVLTTRTDLDKVSVSRAVAKLRRKGMLSEAENASDRRSRFLTLTAEGHAMLAELLPKMVALETKLLATLTPSEQRRILELMERITERIESP